MHIFTIVCALIVVFIVGWALTYPSRDPKNIRYVFWKAGFPTMKLDDATDTMIGDASRSKLVLGKTEKQLQTRFGYLLAPANASEYLRGCYQNSAWKDRKALFIRNSPLMVVFDDNRATDLVLVKGC
jgi:hypothetical protein